MNKIKLLVISFFLVMINSSLYGNPKVILDLPQENHIFNSPIVTVSGTVENSLTLPDGVNNPNIKCWVYFSICGKKFQVAKTYSNGPDWGYMYGKTGSVALFKGAGDTYFGTQSVQVYAVDQYGRKSDMVTRTIVYNEPKNREEILKLLDQLVDFSNGKKIRANIDIEKFKLYISQKIGEELVKGDNLLYLYVKKKIGKSSHKSAIKLYKSIIDASKRYYFIKSEKLFKNGGF